MSDGGIAVSDHGDPSLDAFTRVRLDVSYDGAEFSGWAAQPQRRTVQAVLQEALATVLRLPGVELTVAGRTDAGVHATGQVVHTDLPTAAWRAERDRLVRRLAGILPADVRVLAATPAPPGFHARFSALWRRYEYRICDAESGAVPLRRHVVLAWRRRLDEAEMARAAAQLLGLRDFAAFCKRRDTGTTVRTLQRLDVAREESGEIVCTVQADAFCHSMVRSLVGALLAVGDERRPADWPVTLLTRTSRADDVRVAPAHGLTLLEVGYPADGELAARAELTRARRA